MRQNSQKVNLGQPKSSQMLTWSTKVNSNIDLVNAPPKHSPPLTWVAFPAFFVVAVAGDGRPAIIGGEEGPGASFGSSGGP